MPSAPIAPLRLKELHPAEVRDLLARDARLLIPVGTCEAHGAHLPLGCDTLIVERLVDELSAELQILRAPTVEFGVNTPAGAVPGAAGLRRKTLLRSLNDLIDAWESGGVKEFVLVTAHGQEGHVEALSTVITKGARVQVVDILSGPMPEATASPTGALHADEVDTSLMLHLYPALVHMSRAEDDPGAARSARRSSLRVKGGEPRSVGRPTQASATKGAAIYNRIKELVRDRVLLRKRPDDDE